MRIKAFAEATGLSPHTIRYYESYGLLSPAREGNREGGYRSFTRRDVGVVRVIQHARRLGMPLATIREHLGRFVAGKMAVGELEELFCAQLANVELRLRELNEYRAFLSTKLALIREGEWSAAHFAEAAREAPRPPEECSHY